MATVNPYLIFNGNCEQAFDFYQSVFGGSFTTKSTFGEMPPMPGYEMPEDAKSRIMHVALPISSETILMGSDANPAMGVPQQGQNISLAVGVSSRDEADKIFNGLADGGKINMPMADTFWGAYFGMLTDRFGIEWMVNFDKQ